MLFNSHIFIFAFLPLVGVGAWAARRWIGQQAMIWWLAGMSILFYVWWNPWLCLPLITASLVFNFLVSKQLHRMRAAGVVNRWLLILGVTANLGLLGYFKYANFFVANIGAATGWAWSIDTIVLPIGISFFTFQQIAYLVDVARGDAAAGRFSSYCLFVTFFPQLIAGPIVHHREMMPQFEKPSGEALSARVAIGMTLFAIGLFKKVVLADGMAVGSSPIFDAAADGLQPPLAAAWGAALCYSLQLYFDFSAYSDMAIGLGRLFGIRLPVNFASPYRATSIVDFWRRWHITLSRFLRDYLYIPLGGNRAGPARRYVNVFITMFLGGIWHGGGWTFVIWGAMHGAFIIVNMAWRERIGWRIPSPAAWLLTMLCVIVAWVPFRAANLPTTLAMWRGMLGLNGNRITVDVPMANPETYAIALALLAGAALLPNLLQWMAATNPALATKGYPASVIVPPPRWFPAWRPSAPLAIVLAIAFIFCVLKLNDVSEFIYFQF